MRSWQEREVCRRTLVSLLVLPLVVLAGGTHRLYHKLAGPDHLDRREVMSTERDSSYLRAGALGSAGDNISQ